MTTTLPRMAIDIDATGHAWFPFTTGLDNAVLFAAAPVLPLPGFQWATFPDDDRPHVLLDAVTVSELLFTSRLDPADAVTDETLCDVVTEQLERCHCNVTASALAVAQEAGDHPDAYLSRITQCLALAARIVRTDVTA